MCVIRPKIVAETTLGKIENSNFLDLLKIEKSNKFDKKMPQSHEHIFVSKTHNSSKANDKA